MSEDGATGQSVGTDALRAPAYEALIKQFPNGVIVLFDSDLRYLLVGPSVLPFSKREAAEMEGKTVWELFPEETAAELEPHYRAALDGEPHTFDVHFEERVHNLTTRPVDVPGEPPLGMVVTQDVTEAREREADLERQNRRLEQFASIVSHDLRNPISVASGFLEMEREERDSENLERVAGALDRMNSIVENLLLAAREGSDVEDVTWIDLESVVRQAWSMIESADATLAVETDVEVACDPERLQRVFENLFRNAVGHVGPDVTVTVGGLDDGFFVTDDGPGVAPAIREEAFEPGVSTEEGGTGLGLFIVASIADAHRWTVDLETTDGGTRFAFTDVETRPAGENS